MNRNERFAIGGFHHLKLDVADLSRSLDFYCGKLTFKQIVRFDRQDGVTIVQVSPTGDPPGIELWHEPRYGCYNSDRLHFCFSTDDLEGLVARLKRLGVHVERVPFRIGHEYIAFVRDPDGYLIELNQHLDFTDAASSPVTTAGVSRNNS
jgi:catechol 2,3-dioxygenase-like lactoylglutathione lyase family enzyme